MNLNQFIAKVNSFGRDAVPFLFFIDFECKKPLVFPLQEIDSDCMLYQFRSQRNFSPMHVSENIGLISDAIPFHQYQDAFYKLKNHLVRGNSFLVNLTWKTPVQLTASLRSCFFVASAPYKLWYADHFVVFSPEPFIRIVEDRISSFPMKGTIDASLPGAPDCILSDQKEMAEHVTIVDLIRNDISQVAHRVRVKKFRYVEEIEAGGKRLLQVSSEITGQLPGNWQQALGDLIVALLPAGSVSGAPKARTLEIIREIEGEDRGYYSGVMGIFDGHNLDSAVMIRFIEKQGDQLYYRSGGGITARSDVYKEYTEMLDKIYIPCAMQAHDK